MLRRGVCTNENHHHRHHHHHHHHHHHTTTTTTATTITPPPPPPPPTTTTTSLPAVGLGSISRVYDNLMRMAEYRPVSGNKGGVFTTMLSMDGFIFGVINIS
jgi:G3E family GTPase